MRWKVWTMCRPSLAMRYLTHENPQNPLEHFSAACPVSLRARRMSSLRGRLHRCAMETCSARIDLHTVFALAPWALSLKNALEKFSFNYCLYLVTFMQVCKSYVGCELGVKYSSDWQWRARAGFGLEVVFIAARAMRVCSPQ